MSTYLNGNRVECHVRSRSAVTHDMLVSQALDGGTMISYGDSSTSGSGGQAIVALGSRDSSSDTLTACSVVGQLRYNLR